MDNMKHFVLKLIITISYNLLPSHRKMTTLWINTKNAKEILHYTLRNSVISYVGDQLEINKGD